MGEKTEVSDVKNSALTWKDNAVLQREGCLAHSVARERGDEAPPRGKTVDECQLVQTALLCAVRNDGHAVELCRVADQEGNAD